MDRSFGKLLLIAGLVLVIVGAWILASPKIPWLGRLPGDIRISRDGYSLHIPLVTCLLVSLLLTFLLNLFTRR
jgi:hypothetical protein